MAGGWQLRLAAFNRCAKDLYKRSNYVQRNRKSYDDHMERCPDNE